MHSLRSATNGCNIAWSGDICLEGIYSAIEIFYYISPYIQLKQLLYQCFHQYYLYFPRHLFRVRVYMPQKAYADGVLIACDYESHQKFIYWFWAQQEEKQKLVKIYLLPMLPTKIFIWGTIEMSLKLMSFIPFLYNLSKQLTLKKSFHLEGGKHMHGQCLVNSIFVPSVLCWYKCVRQLICFLFFFLPQLNCCSSFLALLICILSVTSGFLCWVHTALNGHILSHET